MRTATEKWREHGFGLDLDRLGWSSFGTGVTEFSATQYVPMLAAWIR